MSRTLTAQLLVWEPGTFLIPEWSTATWVRTPAYLYPWYRTSWHGTRWPRSPWSR